MKRSIKLSFNAFFAFILIMCAANSNAQNIALNKTARQSSGGSVEKGEAAKAVDGNTSGIWAYGNNNSITHTNDQTDPWWEVDLGAIYDVKEIKIWNRTDGCCWDRLKNFYVMVSQSPITKNSTSSSQFVRGPKSFTNASQAVMPLNGNRRGRYVRIFMKGSGKPLSLAEVQVFGAPVNMALNKTARQSSGGSVKRGEAAKAVDGNTNGIWTYENNNTITHTNDQTDPWWEVDLGAIYDVKEIKIWNRTDGCCWDRLKNFYVMVSQSPITENSTLRSQFVRGPKSFTSASQAVMPLAGNSRGRYVRIFMRGSGKPLSLAEVQVFGAKR